MCGIAGFVDQAADLDRLRAMTDAAMRRGPDDCGYLLEDGVGLGHRRLSIIDLTDAGHQPMEVDGLVITYNGEIYNYREIREDLEQRGERFRSASDTEVILKAFRRWGPRCVDRFIGIFAMAIYDRSERALYLFRDRVGVKPLYYYWHGGRLAFGSELKCLRPYLSVAERTAISSAALSDYFTFGYTGPDHSILDRVRKVPAAHYLKLKDGRLETHRYWNVRFEADLALEKRREEELLDELEQLAISAFTYRMVADVPAGVFLSSGVDSSLVSAVLARHHGRIHTFTIGFDEAAYDESANAREIARHLGTKHTEARLDAETSFGILKRFPEIYDEPFGDTSGVPTTFVSETARAAGMKVVLSGDGGDELFGGYTRYTEFLHRWRQTRSIGPLGRQVASLFFRAAEVLGGPAHAGRFGRYADLLRHDDFVAFYEAMMRDSSLKRLRQIVPALREPAARAGEGDELALMSEWDFRHYLPEDILVKIDRATMFHSIEGREPFLDQRLIEFGARLPTRFKVRNGETKYLPKRLLARYLPEHLCRLPKRGFAVPIRDWMRDTYKQQFLETLDRLSADLFDRRAVNRLLNRYRAGRPVDYTLLWQLFSFQLWHENWLAGAHDMSNPDSAAAGTGRARLTHAG
jgi:asparagine synthase (glutamine-hydrolysing)